jgi:RIO kinase 1
LNAVLVQSYIPKTLDQVKDYEGDMTRISSGKDTEGIYYQTITGLKADLSGVRKGPTFLEESTAAQEQSSSRETLDSVNGGPSSADITPMRTAELSGVANFKGLEDDDDDDDDDDVEEDEDSSESSSDEGTSGDDEDHEHQAEADPDNAVGGSKKEAIRMARKENKKKVKAEQREARKVKVPKALKKKKKKIAKAKSTKR